MLMIFPFLLAKSARLLGSVTARIKARMLLQSFNACFNDTQTFHILGLSNDGMQLRLIRLGKEGLVRGIASIDWPTPRSSTQSGHASWGQSRGQRTASQKIQNSRLRARASLLR
ncbi:hypothetical protein EDB89DRAFT_1921472 [Lactarius sanguifluus]|nr:hypothetical protein EDB89DRAFT_1921472 [Lactarius sanguifluus]